MLCTKCNEKIKPIVALDIDGTLGDYHGHLINFATQYLQREHGASTYDGTIPFKDWFAHAFDITVEEFRQVKLAYRQGGLKRSMPLYPGAVELTLDLSSLGAEIWLTTTRPYLRLDGVDPDTRFWLDHHGFFYDHLLYDENKYVVLANRTGWGRTVAVLDDLPEEISQADHVFGPTIGILRHNMYNLGVRSRVSVGELGSAGELIGLRVGRWEENHGV